MRTARIIAGAAAILGSLTLIAGSTGTALAQEVPPVPTLSGYSDADAFAGQTTALNPPVTLNAGAGTFSFSSLACAFTSDPDAPDGVNASEAGLCSFLVTNGAYANQICGTGTATGSANINTNAGEGSGSVNFTIWFNAGVGVIEGSVASSDDTGASANGVVVITAVPVLEGNCVQGVTGFTAVGAAVAGEGPAS